MGVRILSITKKKKLHRMISIAIKKDSSIDSFQEIKIRGLFPFFLEADLLCW